jgi:hypothetical protein
MPSIRGLLAVCLLFASLSFRVHTAPLEGRWTCVNKTGQVNADTKYTVFCSGDLFFYTNGLLESTCTDALFPTGSQWTVEGNQLHLADSEGHKFITYQWTMPTSSTLELARKGATFLFERGITPVQARN